jgi:hypothetical protein
VAGCPPADIQVAGVIGLQTAQCLGSGVLALRDRDEMKVIRHEAIAPHIEEVAIRVLGEQIEEELSVGVGVEDALAAVAALSEVMRYPGYE